MRNLLDEDREVVTLEGSSQVSKGIERVSPREIPLGAGSQSELWPIREVLDSSQSRIVPLQSGDLIPASPGGHPVAEAIVLPVTSPGQSRSVGVLIAGVNPTRKVDTEYRTFFSLVADQVGTAIQNARAVEQEKKRADALAEIDRAKTEFFSNVSHEFRTPLTLMLGPLEDTLLHPDRLFPEDRERLDVAHRNSLRLLKLVNTLLDFSRIEAGRLQANYEPTDLSDFTADLVSVFRSAIERADLRLIVDCEPLNEPVFIDREMWEKVVFNLLSNAFKFTLVGEIEVSLRPSGDRVALAVRDTGTGIPGEELPHLFERFHRVKNAHGRTFEGSGIGLALGRELVQLNGGAVRVESEPDPGSTFTVAIPFGAAHLPSDRIGTPRGAASPSSRGDAYVQEALHWLPGDQGTTDQVVDVAPAPSAPKPAEHQLGAAATPKPRVLLADDNADMRSYVRSLLAADYDVEVVADGHAALAFARLRTPDVVLSDAMMPNLDGFGLLREMRADDRLKDVPLIMLSARAGEESRIEGLRSGADDYLVKPFSARELIARVSSYINIARTRREATEQERKLRAEAELERGKLRQMFMQVPAVICLLSGPDHRFAFANQECLRMSGRQRIEELAGKPLGEAMPELVGQGYVELLDRVYCTGLPYTGIEMPALLNRDDGSSPYEGHFNVIFQPIRNLAGEVEGILVHAVDVTAQVEARQIVERSEERLRVAQSVAQLGTWEWDPSRNIRVLSSELHRIFGTNANDPNSADQWASRVYPQDWPKVQMLMEEGQDSGEMDFEYRYLHPELGLRWFYCKGRRVQNESRMLGVILDITDRKQ